MLYAVLVQLLYLLLIVLLHMHSVHCLLQMHVIGAHAPMMVMMLMKLIMLMFRPVSSGRNVLQRELRWPQIERLRFGTCGLR